MTLDRFLDIMSWVLPIVIIASVIFMFGRSVERRSRNARIRSLLQYRAGMDEARERLEDAWKLAEDAIARLERTAGTEALILSPGDSVAVRMSSPMTRAELEHMKERFADTFPEIKFSVINVDDMLIQRATHVSEGESVPLTDFEADRHAALAKRRIQMGLFDDAPASGKRDLGAA